MIGNYFYGNTKLQDRETQYFYLKTIWDPVAWEIYWEGIRNNLKTKIANSNATTFLEVNDGD
jgi:hypothetical protein